MIELRNNQLVLRFPEVHEDAILRVDFQRTLRIPDDDRAYPLPPGLGRFPLRHSEALWVLLSGRYPFAVRVATGKIDAVTGKELRPGLARRPQNYLVVPEQPWLDGYCVVRLGKEKGDVPVPENEWLVGLGWRRHACPRKLRSWNPSARSLTL